MDNNEPISVHIKKLEGILYSPPFLISGNRLLDKDVEEYITEQAEAIPKKNQINISIIYQEKEKGNENEIETSIRRHFANCSQNQSYELKHILKLGWTSLITGFIFLMLIYLLSAIIMKMLPANALIITLRELFIILGWVALWKPAELLLYEWRPYKRKIKLYDRLAKSRIDFNKSSLVTKS